MNREIGPHLHTKMARLFVLLDWMGKKSPIQFTNLLTFSPTLALEEHDQCKPHTDWSRKTRKSLALMKAAANPTQPKITSFFQIVDNMEKLVEQNLEIKELMRVAQSQRREREVENICPLHKHLLSNAERNAQMLPQQRRHEQVMKKFATSFFIYLGPMAYEFLH